MESSLISAYNKHSGNEKNCEKMKNCAQFSPSNLDVNVNDQLKDELSRQLKAMLNIPDHSSSSSDDTKSRSTSSLSPISIFASDCSSNDLSYNRTIEEKFESNVQSINKLASDKSSQFNDQRSKFIPPDDELAEKIRIQAENCFSDFNILKDTFLLKHIKSSKEGYISIKLVASFRKVKILTKDWRAVQYSLKKSKFLKLNEQGTKVRRCVPVPNFEDTVYARTVLVLNIPPDKCDSETLSKFITSSFGEITSVKIISPGSKIPEICTKRCLSIHSSFIENKSFALVEFQTNDLALKAIAVCGENSSNKNHIKIVPLMSDSYKNQSNPSSSKRSSKSPKINQNYIDNDNRKKSQNRRNSSGKRQDKVQISSNGLEVDHNNFINKHSNNTLNKNFHAYADHNSSSLITERDRKKSSPKLPLIRNPFDRNPNNSNYYEKRNLTDIGYVRYNMQDHYYSMPPMLPYLRNHKVKNFIPTIGLRDHSHGPMYPLPYYPHLGPCWEMEPNPSYKRNRVHQNGFPKSVLILERDPTLPPNVIRWPKGPDGTLGFHNRRMQKNIEQSENSKKRIEK